MSVAQVVTIELDPRSQIVKIGMIEFGWLQSTLTNNIRPLYVYTEKRSLLAVIPQLGLSPYVIGSPSGTDEHQYRFSEKVDIECLSQHPEQEHQRQKYQHERDTRTDASVSEINLLHTGDYMTHQGIRNTSPVFEYAAYRLWRNTHHLWEPRVI